MKITYVLAAGLLSAALANAAKVDLTKLPPPSKQAGVTFEKDIRPLLQESCVRCHGPERPKGGLRLDSLEGVLKGGKEGKVVNPGNSEKSLVVLAVSQLDPEIAMPPKPRAPRPGQPAVKPAGDVPGGGGPGRQGPPPKPLTPEQVGLVRAWIDQGAK